jgi:hypothetical protein
MTTPQHPSTDQGMGAESSEPSSAVRTTGTNRTKQTRAGLGRHLPWVGARIPVWLPLLIATISFATSTYTFFATNAAPELTLTMPAFIRVAQGPNLGNVAVVYLQPSFTNTGQSARVEVISGMTLRVQPTSGGEPVEFSWQEIDRFILDPLTGKLNYEYVGDAQPLLVSQGNPQAPLANFNGPQGWRFAPGAFKTTLIAARQVNTAPIQRTMEVTFTSDDIAAAESKFAKVNATLVK